MKLSDIFNIFKKQDFPFGFGAIKQPQNPRIELKERIAGDSQPFDWNIGYDIRDTLFHKCGIKEIPVKNQGISGSCGGQASGYFMGVADAINDRLYVEKSARFIYAPCAVKGGGSAEPTLIDRIVNVGSASESLVPSRKTGIDCTEAFMQSMEDIGSSDIDNALSAKGMTPVYLDPTDIDKLAQAIRDNGGFIMGLDGEDNGTWLSAFPKPPRSRKWGHWVYFGQAKLINGKKMLGFKNSWGPIGENSTGWQWIGEDYLAGHTWGAWTFILVNPPKVNYTFNNTLSLGTKSDDVQKLQIVLKNLGFFPYNQAVTNYFGNITKQAVVAFQKHTGLPQTGTVGNLTRAELNKLTQ